MFLYARIAEQKSDLILKKSLKEKSNAESAKRKHSDP
jgi:hypothetical protein